MTESIPVPDDDGSEAVAPPADENDPGDPADSIEDPDAAPATAEPDSPPVQTDASD